MAFEPTLLRPSPSARGSDPGFTLIEITVVIFIVTLVTLLVTPRLQHFLGGDAHSVAREFTGLIGALVQEAVASHTIQRLHYDLDTHEYWVTTLTSHGGVLEESPPIGNKRSLPPDVRFEDVVTPFQGLITKGNTFTQFFPSGVVTRTTIHLKEDAQSHLTLLINPLTGRVATFDRYLEVKTVS